MDGVAMLKSDYDDYLCWRTAWISLEHATRSLDQSSSFGRCWQSASYVVVESADWERYIPVATCLKLLEYFSAFDNHMQAGIVLDDGVVGWGEHLLMQWPIHCIYAIDVDDMKQVLDQTAHEWFVGRFLGLDKYRRDRLLDGKTWDIQHGTLTPGSLGVGYSIPVFRIKWMSNTSRLLLLHRVQTSCQMAVQRVKAYQLYEKRKCWVKSSAWFLFSTSVRLFAPDSNAWVYGPSNIQ